MSLLDPTISVKPRISQMMLAMLAGMKQRYTLVYNYIWFNPTMTPQQVFDGLDIEGAQFMDDAYHAYAFIQKYDETFVLPPLQTIGINTDGSVTLTPFATNPAPETGSGT